MTQEEQMQKRKEFAEKEDCSKSGYSPKPGVYRMPGQRTITFESKTVGGICLGRYIVS